MRLRSRPRTVFQRGGWVPIPPNRSVVITVPEPADIERVGYVVSRLRERNERLSLFFLPGSGEVGVRLSQLFGDDTVLDPPWNNRLSCLLFLLTSRTRLLLVLRDIGLLPPRLVKGAHSLGIGMAIIDAHAPLKNKLAENAQLVDWWLPANPAAMAELRLTGIPDERVAEQSSDDSATFNHLNFLMARRPPDRRKLQKLVMACFDHPWGRRLLALRARRIDRLDELRSALGDPETILCLGSGPSSEDPALDQLNYDCLFRVNHRWLDRGLFCRPDMVFTGQKRTLFTIRGAIFAFQTRRAEAHLLTHQIFNPLCRRMRYVTLERIGAIGGIDWDGVRPTNGATMLATAVALNPKRLIVSGIDLFEDPAGAYPGDDGTANDYVLVHERDLELSFILKTLGAYRGELVILSKVLSEKWNAHLKASAESASAKELPSVK